ncbi:YdiU domain protein [Taphrina deformans PYCC 5710]|uniref:Selenoprotein O n=1 Tax=Taphrina deformans (strain PYCC 5710 / ATCC 11124 / CBS 356.35 / IMI 108563 / JCM 9778 / NBRC 8474) TaxID=1097556 RepID=R4XB84_TAPDE|nr:YdiU domain protein [Taphrina deformans PYCC 5710]|eukprot:CCG80583.1 YdiU domain protein [Taphrina deformans PYCC 5710]
MSTLSSIEKTSRFTQHLPPDPAIPTPQAADENVKMTQTPRQVRGALFTYVKPQTSEDYEVLATSPACFETLGLDPAEANTQAFKDLVSGNGSLEGIYPWAQCYGGYQFGQWASQLGDGRAISLGEVKADGAHERFELQLKGAGKTPYSRFADGNAVLRASIREFLVSEYLHSLGIPTTRALALTLLSKKALRERIEPCAIVTRAAQSWIRIGTFDLLRRRGDRATMKKLADYCIEHVFGGEEALAKNLPQKETNSNRYELLYREIVRRNADLVGKLQAYGFMNGVLNTDNTSIFGLSMDYGPFAFMDTFDSAYTPNHDDGQLRYSYRMQPTIFWWNLTRLGEALAELFGTGSSVDAFFGRKDFLEGSMDDAELEPILTSAEKIIGEVAEEYKETFMKSYKLSMSKRFDMPIESEEDFKVVSEALTLMENYELDFHHFFQRLSEEKFSGAAIVEGVQGNFGGIGRDKVIEEIDAYLEVYKKQVATHGIRIDSERSLRMKKANPAFVLRSWILDEVIQRVEHKGERDILREVLDMSSHPFKQCQTANGARFCGPVPSGTISGANTQCSCSS